MKKHGDNDTEDGEKTSKEKKDVDRWIHQDVKAALIERKCIAKKILLARNNALKNVQIKKLETVETDANESMDKKSIQKTAKALNK